MDSEFRTKVADFGLARMLVQAGTPDTMSAVAWSFGYMAPGKEPNHPWSSLVSS
uniref:Protein kinase domain-containing protein n=1 Tax=Aegilops tauschii subsp. strangulata TaxID=200361 RepID=A0A453FFD0_AEGTS